ncbi:MAG: lipoyl(octanoyl) transferase LipB [Taibaiella sp.]|nr:lipoyl(octanoyl) transferase LipB [Taibaiella sp.]
MMQTIYFKDLGVIEYGAAWDMQEELMQRNVKAKSIAYVGASEGIAPAPPKTTDYLFFCEHPSVYTLGKSGHIENLLVNDARLAEMNVSFYKTNRGGDITYHGPGQVVAYPILDLEHYFTDLGKYMRCLEEAVINTLAAYNINGERLPGATGVWIEASVPGRARKICAMGVRCSRWITMHGLALNVNTDLKFFDYIVPCGITDKSVTSMERELGKKVDEMEVKEKLLAEFARIFHAEILPYSVQESLTL